jgi:NTP pyrophosphatase (non-canonical NTP hydrolase)
MSNSSSLGFVSVFNEAAERKTMRYDVFVSLLFKQEAAAEMKKHAALLVAGEAGEVVDAVKKDAVYGKEIDLDNLIEELGDLRFGIQAVMNLYGISEQTILQHNANKLAKRYAGLTYSNAAAIARADKNGTQEGK